MAPWKGPRRNSWASNGNISVYIFGALFIVWLAFQIWARLPGGPPPPTGLDPMVMAALGVAVTSKSVEKRAADEAQEASIRDRQSQAEVKLQALEDVAAEEHPDRIKKRPAPKKKQPKSEVDDESPD